ncbi:MAG: recombinase RecA [Gemmatimonadales bacterium]|nr:recombinase RecA [Gemmatimonadales bacterium]MDZ4388692.1 recombinase RecA [Gemmatimonadales bacterium]
MTATATTRGATKAPSVDILALFPSDRREALRGMLGDLDKRMGKGTVQTMGGPARRVDCIPSGSLKLDAACGVGGIPKGRVTEIYGPESSGKTTLALSLIANVQRAGGVAAFIDAEHALDPTWAMRIGVNMETLLITQPDTGEQALEIVEAMVRSGVVDLIVVDSVAALTPKAEIEGEMGDSHVGLQARLMSQALRKITAILHQSNASLLFINQLRERIGVMFGNPETTTGGKALKFYASLRLDIRRIGAIKERETVVGSRTRVKIVKNKVAPPFKQAEFDIRTDGGDTAPGGIDMAGELLDEGVEMNLVQKSGAWYAMGSERIGQGREQARQWLLTHPEALATLEAELRKKLFPAPIESGAEEAPRS